MQLCSQGDQNTVIRAFAEQPWHLLQRPCTSRTTSMRLGMVPTPRSCQRQERRKATSRRLGGGASWSTSIRSRKDPHQTASCWARSPERERSQPKEELQPGVLSWLLNTSSTRPRSTPAPASLSRAPSHSLVKDGSALSLEALVNSGDSGATHWGNRWKPQPCLPCLCTSGTSTCPNRIKLAHVECFREALPATRVG